LPSVFGGAFSVVLIQYAKPLSYLGILVVLGYSVYSAVRLRRELKRRKMFETKQLREQV